MADVPNAYQAWREELVAQTHEVIQRSLKILRETSPDTFVGRKTQEPFPKEEIRRRNP
ncbi:hypothetical protein [Bradyrhizobium elkanii]|uniref:hypothetical protein n=1 Tax=Bradyrhizobium elkanii TaxID=29448 RepID=UPI001BA4A7B5|nr:hypothetical protein [Bradyrhizobium elkanii]MBR1160879.1 hypothetical protein [Bradyrhizobium elkanii]